MRCATAFLTLLLGCGEIPATATDAAVGGDAAADAPPDAAPIVPRLYALTSAFGMGATLYGLEIVDLRTMTKLQRFPLGAGNATSVAVSPDGHTAYVSDLASAEVSFISTSTGMPEHTVALGQVRDLVLSSNGQRLFAAAGDKLVAIDTSTRMTTPSLSLGTNRIALGLALSPDGQRLVTATTNGGSNPTVALVRTSDMSIEAQVPITTDVTGCASAPFTVAFSDTGLLVSWDNNCDELYQIDAGTHTQLTMRNIATGRDSGSGGWVTSRLATSAKTHLAYAVREEGNLAIMNPQTLTFTLATGFTDMPQALVSSASGDKLYVSVIHQFTTAGAADTIDVLDTASSGFQRDAYTFSVTTQSVLDMAVVESQ
jgi:DNA-binding beta-propeller fold protein YncE